MTDEALAARLAADLAAGRRVRVQVAEAGPGRSDVTVVAYDARGLLAVVCGVLAVHGLDVESGVAEALDVPGPLRAVADVFRVFPLDGKHLDVRCADCATTVTTWSSLVSRGAAPAGRSLTRWRHCPAS